MHLAAEYGRAELVELLLTAGAAVDTKDQYGRGPTWRGVDEGSEGGGLVGKMGKMLMPHRGASDSCCRIHL